MSTSKDQSNLSKSQTLYVLAYPAGLFAAHWSFFLPETQEKRKLNLGTRVHVTGDRLNGFVFEVDSEYSIAGDNRNISLHSIGLLLDSRIGTEVDGVAESFVKRCREITAPGPSLNRVGAAGVVPKKLEVRDCQWWIKDVVKKLDGDGTLVPLKDDISPVKNLEQVPKH